MSRRPEDSPEAPQGSSGRRKKRWLAPAVGATLVAIGIAVTTLVDCPPSADTEQTDGKPKRSKRGAETPTKAEVPGKQGGSSNKPATSEGAAPQELSPTEPTLGEPKIVNSDNTQVRVRYPKSITREDGLGPEDLKMDRILFNCDSINGLENFESSTNGAQWVSQDAINLRVDGKDFQEGGGSYAFDIDPSKGTIGDEDGQEYGQLNFYFWNEGQTKDLSEYAQDGVISLWVYVPDINNFEHVQLYVGANESSFVIHTVNDSNGLQEGWNFIEIPLEVQTLNTAGVNIGQIGYMALIFQGNYAYNETRNDFRVDAIGVSHGFQQRN